MLKISYTNCTKICKPKPMSSRCGKSTTSSSSTKTYKIIRRSPCSLTVTLRNGFKYHFENKSRRITSASTNSQARHLFSKVNETYQRLLVCQAICVSSNYLGSLDKQLSDFIQNLAQLGCVLFSRRGAEIAEEFTLYQVVDVVDGMRHILK